jgi:ABC-type Fe3+ transport system substrate-binding protein
MFSLFSRRRAVVVAICCLIAFGAAGCGAADRSGTSSQPSSERPTTTLQLSPEINRLIAAAAENRERELVLTWDEAALGGSVGAKRLEALFQQMYGVDARVHFTPGPTMPAMAAKVAQEVAAGQPTSTDIFLGTGAHCNPLLDRNVFEAYDYTQLSPRITRSMIEPGDMCVEVSSSFGGIVYNTELVAPAEVPRRLEDVLSAKWKGRIASTPYAAYFDRVARRPEWSIDRMKEFLRGLSGNAEGLIRVNEVNRIISGEFAMLVLGSDKEATAEKSNGAPVDFVIPEDVAHVHFSLMAIPRTAPHPNLGKLFVNTVLSEEGQKILYETALGDHHELPGSRSVEKLRGLEARGIKPLRFDLKLEAAHPELQAARADFQKILQERQ